MIDRRGKEPITSASDTLLPSFDSAASDYGFPLILYRKTPPKGPSEFGSKVSEPLDRSTVTTPPRFTMAIKVERVVFLSLLLDLFAFTIPLPLFPRIIEWYTVVSCGVLIEADEALNDP